MYEYKPSNSLTSTHSLRCAVLGRNVYFPLIKNTEARNVSADGLMDRGSELHCTRF